MEDPPGKLDGTLLSSGAVFQDILSLKPAMVARRDLRSPQDDDPGPFPAARRRPISGPGLGLDLQSSAGGVRRQWMVAFLMGLDGTTFWSDAVPEPLTGEHFGICERSALATEGAPVGR